VIDEQSRYIVEIYIELAPINAGALFTSFLDDFSLIIDLYLDLSSRSYFLSRKNNIIQRYYVTKNHLFLGQMSRVQSFPKLFQLNRKAENML